MEFKTIRSEQVYGGKIFSVRHDEVLLPDGRKTFLDVVDHGGSVTIVPVDDLGRMWFVRQYRYAVNRELLELPAGTLEVGEDPLTCAAREIREEIGMAAGELIHLGEFYLVPGYATEYMHIFLARDLTPAPLEGDADEFLKVEKMRVEDAYAKGRAGDFRDGKTLAALLLAAPYLEKSF